METGDCLLPPHPFRLTPSADPTTFRPPTPSLILLIPIYTHTRALTTPHCRNRIPRRYAPFTNYGSFCRARRPREARNGRSSPITLLIRRRRRSNKDIGPAKVDIFFCCHYFPVQIRFLYSSLS